MEQFEQFPSPDTGSHEPDVRQEATSTLPTNSPAVGESRRYRDDVPYVLPKDTKEDERLDLQHFIFYSILKGNYAAPVDLNMAQILDVGSGSGIWGREVALQFPSARVFGMDLEPPQAPLSSASLPSSPSNYLFVQGNVLQSIPFPDDTFDFTHQRMLIAAIPSLDWPRIVQELVRVTRSGGWIELFEASAGFVAGPASEQLHQWSQQLLQKRGIDLSSAEELGTMLTMAGLREVKHQPIDIPLGAWDTRIGILMERNALAGYQAFRPHVCKYFQIAPATFDQQLATALLEWKQQQTCWRFHLAYGRV